MPDYVKAWQCIGCGKIEAPQTCVGVCRDRKVEFVYADDHRQALSALAAERTRAGALEALVRRLAWTIPHDHAWEASFRALQAQARTTLAGIDGESRILALPSAAACGAMHGHAMSRVPPAPGSSPA